MNHIDALAAKAKDAAKARMGIGWSVLSPDLQEALVAREALSIIAQNEDNEGWQRAALLASKVLAGR